MQLIQIGFRVVLSKILCFMSFALRPHQYSYQLKCLTRDQRIDCSVHFALRSRSQLSRNEISVKFTLKKRNRLTWLRFSRSFFRLRFSTLISSSSVSTMLSDELGVFGETEFRDSTLSKVDCFWRLFVVCVTVQKLWNVWHRKNSYLVRHFSVCSIGEFVLGCVCDFHNRFRTRATESICIDHY